MAARYEVRPVGHVESPPVDRQTAPKQGFEGAPDAWLVFDPEVAEGLRDLAHRRRQAGPDRRTLREPQRPRKLGGLLERPAAGHVEGLHFVLELGVAEL
jgi:hypothetical protein